jgi:transcriptional regulator with XRE-family HTH domain
MTQEQAAEKAAIHVKHHGVIEGGKTNVTVGTLVALAYAYDVPLWTLFATEGAKEKMTTP